MTMGIWYESLIRWVGEATAVVARGQTYVKMRLDPQSNQMKAVRIPEHITILADMVCGAQATISVSQVTGLMPSREAVLYGSQGTLRFADGKLYGGRRGDNALQEIEIPANEQSFWRVEEEFVGAIRGQEVIQYTSFETGVKYMEFTEAVTRSMADGCVVTLPL
jgi:predicted dehydrogenase